MIIMRAKTPCLFSIAAAIFMVWTSAFASSLSRVDTETRTIFFNDIYELTLWTPTGQLARADLENAQGEKRLELVNKYGGDLPDLPEGWSIHLEAATDDKQMGILRSAYNSLVKGDIISLSYTPASGTQIRKNGDLIVSTRDHNLTSALLKIWFGDDAVSSSIKEEFLE